MSRIKLLLAALVASAAFPAQAGLIVYTGADNAITTFAQMVNSQAAAASFDAAVPGASLITFESPLPAGVSVNRTITNNSGCGALCGINTTPGGAFFLFLFGGSATISFVNPVDALGFYVTGLQTDQVPQETLTFSDGSTQVINTPDAIRGGGAFIGFTDFGKQITSVTYNATNDIVAIDDLRFHSAVPEPGSLALFALALTAFAAARRRR